jgi:hypothetical protein
MAMTTMSDRREPLTATDVYGLSKVIDAVPAHVDVRYLAADDETILTGTLCRICGPDGTARPDDIRDCYVEITDRIVTRYESVARLATLYINGGFAVSA